MWVQFDDKEIATIIAALGAGAIADKLKTAHHPDADAFINAADCYSDDIHIPIGTSIERTRNGAYVLVDLWIENSRAGFLELSVYDNFDVTDETRASLEALTEFNIAALVQGKGCGAIHDWFWETDLGAGKLEFYVGPNRESPKQNAIWSAGVLLADGAEEVNDETCFQFILRYVQAYHAFRQTTRTRE